MDRRRGEQELSATAPDLLPQPGGFEGLAQRLKDLPQQDTSASACPAEVDVGSGRECPFELSVGSLTERTGRPALSFREVARARVERVEAAELETAPLRSAQSPGWLKKLAWRQRRGRSGHGPYESGSDHHRRRCNPGPSHHVVVPFRGQAIPADPISLSTGASLHPIRAESRKSGDAPVGGSGT